MNLLIAQTHYVDWVCPRCGTECGHSEEFGKAAFKMTCRFCRFVLKHEKGSWKAPVHPTVAEVKEWTAKRKADIAALQKCLKDKKEGPEKRPVSKNSRATIGK